METLFKTYKISYNYFNTIFNQFFRHIGLKIDNNNLETFKEIIETISGFKASVNSIYKDLELTDEEKEQKIKVYINHLEYLIDSYKLNSLTK